MTCILPLPLEILIQITTHMPYEMVERLGDVREIRRLVESNHFWRGRVLTVTTRKQLLERLRDPGCRKARRLDLRGADLDDTDLMFIANHFDRIEHLNLSHVSALTDDGLEALLKLHGRHLKSLTLHRLFRLTNVTLHNIVQWCGRSLRRLDLQSTMISAAGLLRLVEGGELMIRELILARCHIVDPTCLPALGEGLPALRRLSVAQIDAVQPYQLQALAQSCPTLRLLDVTGCPEVTRKTLKHLSGTHRRLHIKHDARLEDHSLDSIRRFLLGLVAVQ